MIHFECNCGICDFDLSEILSWEDEAPVKCSRCESSLLLVTGTAEKETIVEVEDVAAIRRGMAKYVETLGCQSERSQ